MKVIWQSVKLMLKLKLLLKIEGNLCTLASTSLRIIINFRISFTHFSKSPKITNIEEKKFLVLTLRHSFYKNGRQSAMFNKRLIPMQIAEVE